MIFDIQRYAIHDGGGIRTLIFFKGCTLKCAWCDNPESQSPGYDIMWNKRICMGCGDCAAVSNGEEIELTEGGPEIHRDKIKDFSLYENICPTGALNVVGKNLSMEEIIEEIKKDIPFYKKSGGGVTITGGEPFMQEDFLVALLHRVKDLGIHIAVETSLYVKWKSIEKSLPFINVFLADLKHVDEEKFKEYTGGQLSVIIENFSILSSKIKSKKDSGIVARIPVIPDFNATDGEMESIFDFAANLRAVKNINLIPYHTLGVGKYELLERDYTFKPKVSINDKMLLRFCKIAERKGLKCSIGG